MDTTQYIRECCEMQNATTPEDFIGMARAYETAIWRMWARPHFVFGMHMLPDLICPILNEPRWVEFRSQPATFANGREANKPSTIQPSLKKLFESWNDRVLTSPTEFYWRFEEIHPWRDGNGRVGSLLFNLLNSTIMNPIHPDPDPIWSR